MACGPATLQAQDASPQNDPSPDAAQVSKENAEDTPDPQNVDVTIVEEADVTYKTSKHSFEDVELEWLTQWLQRFGFNIPTGGIKGKVSTTLEFQWPIDALMEPRVYRIDGELSSKQLQIGDFTVTNFESELKYRQGHMNLTKFQFDVGPDDANSNAAGRVEGSGTAMLFPLGHVEINLLGKQIPLAYLATTMESELPDVTGTVSFNVEAVGEVTEAQSIDEWTATGKFEGDNISADCRPTVQLRDGSISLGNSSLRLENVRVLADGGEAAAAASILLKDSYPFETKTDLERFDLAMVPLWLLEDFTTSGSAKGTLSLNGTLQPFQYQGSGKVQAERAGFEGVTLSQMKANVEVSSAKAGTRLPKTIGDIVAQTLETPFGQTVFDDVTMKYQTDDDGLHMTDIQGKVQDGHFGGQAMWPWDNAMPATANIQWQDVDIVDIALQGSRTKLKANGKSCGTLAWSALPHDLQDITLHDIELQSEIPELIVNGVPSGNIVISVTRQPADGNQTKAPSTATELRYDIRGSLLRGDVAASGNIAKSNAGNHERVTTEAGTFSLRKADLGLAAQILIGGQMGRNFRGTLSASGNSWPLDGVVEGKVTLENIRFQRQTLSDRISADFGIDPARLNVNSVSGLCYGGRLRGEAEIPFGEQGRLNAHIVGMSWAEAADTVYPGLEDYFGGRVNLSVRASGSQAWRGTASLTGQGNRLGPLRVRSMRVPMNLAFDAQGNLDAHSRNVSVDLSTGRIAGDVKIRSRQLGLSLNSNVRFYRIALHSLSKQLTGTKSPIGTGDLSGALKLQGQRIRSFNDLQATLTAKIDHANAESVPLIPQLERFVGVSLAAVQFDEGTLKASLGKGRVKVHDLRFSNPNLLLHANGTYFPMSGRLAMDLTASTAEVNAKNALRKVVVRNVAALEPTTAAIANVHQFLSDRVILIHADGTLSRPNFSLRPAASISQEVLRYFARQLTAEFVDLDF